MPKDTKKKSDAKKAGTKSGSTTTAVKKTTAAPKRPITSTLTAQQQKAAGAALQQSLRKEALKIAWWRDTDRNLPRCGKAHPKRSFHELRSGRLWELEGRTLCDVGRKAGQTMSG